MNRLKLFRATHPAVPLIMPARFYRADVRFGLGEAVPDRLIRLRASHLPQNGPVTALPLAKVPHREVNCDR